MNDAAIKNFCIEAREQLLREVRTRMAEWNVAPGAPPVVNGLHGRLLSPREQQQRSDLITRLEVNGEEALAEQAAYTWFNRFMAIRYMELNDRLPFGTRMVSADDGSFAPQVLKEALYVDIEGLDRDEVVRLVQAGDDEALFRCLFLAACAQLSDALPYVFEPVGNEMELLLPKGLLLSGSVLQKLVDDIPEEDWREGVEIVGWMYQYYNSAPKDEAFAEFKKGKKASARMLAPATQLFTPHWIVRYLTENSLGRLWMRSHPESALPQQMPYYIPEASPDELRRAEILSLPPNPEPPISPESIKVIDPACGSGHILVYAFRLLAAMYEEAGYRRREIPQLILEKNLTGCDIDPRAVQMASFALAMVACEWDSRFLQREGSARPRIVLFRNATIRDEELEDQMPYLGQRTQLLDAMAHMDECGSLFVPQPEDIEALELAQGELNGRMGGNDLLAMAPAYNVDIMLDNCRPLAEKYDVVLANPPYMGSSNLNKWMADWTKKNYPDSKRDLCTCFIERGFTLAKSEGYSAMVTMQSWMFLGSFEALRHKLLDERSIASMAHLGTRGFDAIGGEVVATTATVFRGVASDEPADYLRLVDFDGEASKEQAIREAIQNPDCGWFYRRNAEAFKSIPGTPIAYWASDAMIRAFEEGVSLMEVTRPRVGMKTGRNDEFLRLWWEVPRGKEVFDAPNQEAFSESKAKWAPYNKGGEFRKWYGNLDYVVNWENEGESIRTLRPGEVRTFSVLPEKYRFVSSVTWSSITSSAAAFRFRPSGSLYDISGMTCLPPLRCQGVVLAICNSSIGESYLSLLSPTINKQIGDIGKIPLLMPSDCEKEVVNELVSALISLSSADWNSLETSWEYARHPMR